MPNGRAVNDLTDGERRRIAAGDADGVAPAPATMRIDITVRSVVITIAVMAGAWMLFRLTPVLIMIVGALMLVGLLNPVVARLQHLGARRSVSIGLVFIVLLALVLLTITLTIPELVAQASELIEREPAMRDQLAAAAARHTITASLATSIRRVDYAALLGGSAERALASSLAFVEIVAYSVGALFLALYIMVDVERLRAALYALIPRRAHIRLTRIMVNLEGIVGGYIRGQLITCAAMGLFMFALLTAVGIKSALALAVLAGLADVLPYVGGLVALVPAVLVALPLGAVTAGSVGAAILVYQEVESRLLVPMVYGKSLRLPSSVVLVALLAGGTLGGIIGALLALPFASALVMIVSELRVQLPGEGDTTQQDDLRTADARTAREYDARSAGMSVHEAAGVAAAIVAEDALDNPIDGAAITEVDDATR